MRLQNKHIVVGITGGIAAYKSASLVRLLIKEGAEVQVVMTPAAKEFITPLTLATLSQHAVVSDFFDQMCIRDRLWAQQDPWLAPYYETIEAWQSYIACLLYTSYS